MILGDIKRTLEANGDQRLSALLTFETPRPTSFPVYYLFRNPPGDLLPAADPFLITSLVAGMLFGEDIEVRGPVDRELLVNIEMEIIPVLLRWFPSLQPIEVRCREIRNGEPGNRAGAGGAAAFSSGLDAVYTALRHRDSLQWLVATLGFDIYTFRPRLWDSVSRQIGAAAKELSLPLLLAETNIREVAHCEAIRLKAGKVPADYYRVGPNGPIGPFLAGLGRCMEPFCSRFLINAAVPYEWLAPYGTHPLLDPMWSTSAQRIGHSGCDEDRIGKLKYINRTAPGVLPYMRVCHHWTAGSPNCGECEKCLRTMIEAHLAGVEPGTMRFARPLDVNRVKRLQPGPPQILYWSTIANQAAQAGETAIARAANIALGKRFHLPRLLRLGVAAPSSDYDPAARWMRIRHRMKSVWETRVEGDSPEA